ncbi:hypothetical protein ACLOJK_039183 [Asimina triloba]
MEVADEIEAPNVVKLVSQLEEAEKVEQELSKYTVCSALPEHGAPVWCSIIFPNPAHLQQIDDAIQHLLWPAAPISPSQPSPPTTVAPSSTTPNPDGLKLISPSVTSAQSGTPPSSHSIQATDDLPLLHPSHCEHPPISISPAIAAASSINGTTSSPVVDDHKTPKIQQLQQASRPLVPASAITSKPSTHLHLATVLQ